MTTTYDFEHDGKTYAAFTAAAAQAAGVPQAMIAAAIASERREAIKAECRSRIYGTASSEAQMNINGYANLISSKLPADRTPQDIAFMASFQASLQWISDMRGTVEAMTLDPSIDIHADASWPDCPADVVALAAQF